MISHPFILGLEQISWWREYIVRSVWSLFMFMLYNSTSMHCFCYFCKRHWSRLV